MKRLSFTIFLCFSTILVGAQQQSPAICIPPYYVDLISPLGQTGNLRTLPQNNCISCYQGAQANYSSNMVLDYEGNIKFFIVDGEIFDREGNSIGSCLRGHSETVIIPRSESFDCNSYYVISSEVPDNGITLRTDLA
ncbi:MAG: hypothetical protein K1X56_01575 [Flavobacteriales bacterium]|nr:hypothetical protein [Flavobacteriales bacterium]